MSMPPSASHKTMQPPPPLNGPTSIPDNANPNPNGNGGYTEPCSPTTSPVPWSPVSSKAHADPHLLIRLEAKYRASSRFPAALYASLQTDSVAARSAALQSTAQVVRSWVDACYNPHAQPHADVPASSPNTSPPPSASFSSVIDHSRYHAIQSRSADSSPPPPPPPPSHDSSSLSADPTRHGSSDSSHLARSNSASSSTAPTLAQAAASAVNLFRSKSAGSSAAAAAAARRSSSISLASPESSSSGSASISTSTTHSYASASTSDPTGSSHHDLAPTASNLESRIMLHLHLTTLVRLATTCPYADIRSSLRTFLRTLKADFPHLPLPRPIHPSPSYFIASTHLVPLPAATDHETLLRQPGGAQGKRLGYGTVRDVRVALDDVFTHSSAGRVSHLARVLAYFPRYLQKTHRAHRHLVRDMPGPLPRTWRLFLGLLAAAQLKNVAVASLMRSEYLHAGGDPSWLMAPCASTGTCGGVRAGTGGAVPPKLVAVAKFNALLAHQPWRLRATHIARLVVDHGWSVGELVHGIVVLASVHAQCAMAFGTGVAPDVDTPGGAVYVVQEADEMRRGSGRDESVDLSTPQVVPIAVPPPLAAADESVLLASPSLGASANDQGVLGVPELGPDGLPPAVVVSAAELSLTDQLITRLMESANANSVVGADDDGVPPVTPSGSFTEPIDGADGSEKHRRQLFEKCEGPESMSDSETERDLVPPHVDHTYLRSIPPPTPCPTALPSPTSLHTWWSAPGTYPAMDAYDLSALVSMYTADPAECDGVTGHQDFDVKSPDYSVFRLTDWCWEDHGLELVSKYLGHELGEYLDEEFEEARHMTIYSLFSTGDDEDDEDDEDEDWSDGANEDDDNDVAHSIDAPIRTSSLPPPGGDTHSIAGSTSTVGVSGIDTHPFREAIWYYVLRLFGQSMDDYNYSMVNHFVNKRTKAFIKKVATAPHTLQYRDWMRMGVVLRPEEKAHVVVLVAEARKQAELVWALSAVVKYLDGGRAR
ncbi:PA26 p53-induced protein-domain-containing protein [Catenaria anguillulae PL171]|uniref:PA26 p53-induced protein-domain-containing protein n=1 Tax=Catenaria anguillulae PL171 TaxID=765915 RepID=A0A1Y2HSK7_9FUNG|nr:PA26 p53-induced protein-domain-containing protein [Catenaria anguillulae PL171]